MSGVERLALGVAAAHVSLSMVHGLAHLGIPVPVPAWQYGYAALVILLAPVPGVALIRRGLPARGAGVLLLSGLAALVFEGAFHFLVVNPDHVSTVDHGHAAFAATAALSTVGDAALFAVGAWLLLRWALDG